MSRLSAPNLVSRDDTSATARAGVIYGLLAYISWGVAPLYFKVIITRAPALEVLAHRVLWSSVFLLGLVAVRRQLPALRRILLQTPKVLAVLCCTTALISVNWYVFIWVHETGEVLQASLGYFINPLISVALGFVVLGERLRRLQVISVLLAAAGVTYLAVASGEVPTIALVLACTFAAYGLIRKLVAVEAMVGLTVETLLLAPLCIAYLAWAATHGGGAFRVERSAIGTDALLLAGGVVTALPLLWFTCAARRLRLVTVGFLQYLAPSGQFFIAWLVFKEPLSTQRLVCFAIIWIALTIYSFDALRASRAARRGRDRLANSSD